MKLFGVNIQRVQQPKTQSLIWGEKDPTMFNQVQKYNFLKEDPFYLSDNSERPNLSLLESMPVGQSMLQARYGINPWEIFDIARKSDLLRTIFTALNKEIFRNGMKVEPVFNFKCSNPECECEYKTNDNPICELCQSPLRSPDIAQKAVADQILTKKLNMNNETLKDILQQIEYDLDVYDDGYLIMLKDYKLNEQGEIETSSVRDIIRANPIFMKIIADEDGRPGRDGKAFIWTCINHRSKTVTNEERPICQDCNIPMQVAYFVAHQDIGLVGSQPDARVTHYIEGEVCHTTKYTPSMIVGFPPIISVYMKVKALMAMDKLVWDWYRRQRPPGSLLLVSTSNTDSLMKAWGQLLDRTRSQPWITQPLPVERGDGQSGPIAEVVKLMDTLADMQYTETRDEMRRTVGAVFGIMPLFLADNSKSGGLNNDSQEITVTTRAVDAGQQVFNEKVLPIILDQFGVTEWKIVLNATEEKNEMSELQVEAQRIQNALAMTQLGFQVELDEDGEFKYFKAIQQPYQEVPQQPVQGQAPQVPMEQQREGEPPSTHKQLPPEIKKMWKDYKEKYLQTGTPDEIVESFDGMIKSAFEMVKKDTGIILKSDPVKIRQKMSKALLRRTFKGISIIQSNQIKAHLISSLKGGTSIRGIANKIMDIAPRMEKEQALTIARTEMTSLNNTAKELAYKEADEEGKYKFKWSIINDNRTTEFCKAIAERSKKGVSLDVLKKIIESESDPNIQKRDWVPHISCRSVISRIV